MIYIHWAILVVYTIVVVAAMITVIMDNREPAKTMAWVLVLSFMPLVGIILYFFFGQNTRKEKLISQRSLDQLTKRSMTEFAEQRDLKIPESQQPLIRLFSSESFSLPFKDNQVEIYTSGYEFFPALMRAISQAHDHIHLESFIFADDELGNLIADTLIDKAREGVEIRVIYDDVGSWTSKNRFFERMRNEGIDVHAFMPVKFPAFTSKANYRNHRKLCVIDGKVGFIGGMNIATRYVKGTKHQTWRDTHLRVEGGGVYGIQRAFLVDWYYCDRTLITNRRYYPETNPLIHNNCIMQVATSSPITKWPDIMQGYVRVLLQAKRYVYMESPYFLPTEPILFAMRTAALAGVDVRLMVPFKSDSKLINWASRSYVLAAAEAGVKVYLYKSAFNHSKIMVSDDIISTCGSTNVDFRSFEHNFESNAFFYDEEMALRLKSIYMNDEKECFLLADIKDLSHRPFLERLWGSIIRLLSPLL